MFFASPLWLLALLPWAGLVVWTLRRVQPSTLVPFVRLWQFHDVIPSSPENRRWHRPPLTILMLLAAILACIIAAGQPMIRRAGDLGPITVMLDRGIESSATVAAWNQSAIDAQDKILRTFGPGRCEFICVPGMSRESIDRANLSRSIREHPPTALDTTEPLASALHRESQSLLIVLSNQKLAPNDACVQQLSLRTTLKNIAITHLGISDTPKPAAMVTLRNDGFAGSRAKLSIAVDRTPAVEKEVALPGAGAERDEFIDLPQSGDTLRAEIEIDDDIPIDNVAFAARETAWPRIEPSVPVPESLRRFINTYTKLRPPAKSSVAIMIDDAVRATAQPSVTIAAAINRPTSQPLTVADHPITRNVADWRAILADAKLADRPPPGDGWTPIVRLGNSVALATRADPVRQVWIGFDSPGFAKQVDYVVFWTAVFDWLADHSNVSGRWVSREVVDLGNTWRRDDALSGMSLSDSPTTGIYRGENSGIVALSPQIKIAELSTDKRPLNAEMLLHRADKSLEAVVLWVALTGLLISILLMGVLRK